MNHDVLLQIAKVLNENDIRWGLGASYALHFRGLVKSPRDIDLIVAEEDIIKTVNLLKSFGQLEEEPPKGDYLTEYFYYFKIDETEIDVISNFKLKHETGVYTYHFDALGIVDTVLVEDVNIPLTALEDWYILYLVMNNKKQRGDMIEAYFQTHGIKHLELIKRGLKQDLPRDVRKG